MMPEVLDLGKTYYTTYLHHTLHTQIIQACSHIASGYKIFSPNPTTVQSTISSQTNHQMVESLQPPLIHQKTHKRSNMDPRKAGPAYVYTLLKANSPKKKKKTLGQTLQSNQTHLIIPIQSSKAHQYHTNKNHDNQLIVQNISNRNKTNTRKEDLK